MPADYDLEAVALAEANAVVNYYEAQRAGLGQQFADELQACIDRVRASPLAYRLWHGPYRRANLQRFPYFILYSYDGTTVVVRAVQHSARDPGPLKTRLGD